MEDSRHRAIKSWERSRQLEGLRKERALAGPAAWCRFQAETTDAVARLPVYIVHIFEKDVACVKACHEPVPVGVPGPCWIVAGGIRWEEYLPGIVRHWRGGWPVPAPFSPIRKLGEELLERLEVLPPARLPEVFLEMRRAGLLPPLLPLTRSTCPPGLSWEGLRALFRDFRGGGSHG